MHPVLFELGGIKIYSYGFMIALGAVLGVAYMARQGKKELGMTGDQANNLFLLIFVAAFVGGKLFLIFEDASYLTNPRRLISGNGFVFYGSFLFGVPTMLWFFRKHKLPALQMLDIMAITTCLVHMCGRVGCFMAGCCYGIPTNRSWGVVFTDPACAAKPLGTALHPTQLYEAGYILLVMVSLLVIKSRYQKFRGQLFLLYLILYAVGRIVIEIFRGDSVRGFLIENVLSTSQTVALLVIALSLYYYVKWSKSKKISFEKRKGS